jgi:oxygen-independent coproporphyrinogen III oxidase
MSGDVSLYFHIPFCTKKCHYCHFFVLPNKAEEHKKFIQTLKLEWDLRKSALDGLQIKSIYFGGGTPSLLSPEYITEILSWIPHESNIEITIEANPEHLTQELLKGFFGAGINRLSIGVQSFDDSLLLALGRTHGSKTALDALEWSFQAGFRNISIDLMYDLPCQTLKTWTNTLQIAANLPITHLSLYNLTIEPQTLFFKNKEKLQKQIPSPEISLKMYQQAQNILPLTQYEISAFAKEDCYSRHNTGYWTGRPFLGFGPSAYSFWEGKRFCNIAHMNQYQKALEAGKDPVDLIDELPVEERRKELFAVEMRLCQGVDLESFQNRHGLLANETFETLDRLKKIGWIEQEGSRYRLTPQGILFYDSVAEDLI